MQEELYKRLRDIGESANTAEKYELAVASFTLALVIKNNCYSNWQRRGFALSKLKRYEEAIFSYDQAIQNKSSYCCAWTGRGFAAGQLGDDDEVLKYTEYLELFKQDIKKSLENINPELEYSRLDFHNQKIIRENIIELLNFIKKSGRLPHHFDSHDLLNKRGYEGAIASYSAELGKSIRRETEPKCWENLHGRIGQSHYFRGRRQPNCFYFWDKAKSSYEKALPQSLQPPKYPELHLRTLQGFIEVLLYLKEIQEAQKLRHDGTEIFRRILADPKTLEDSKKRLALKFASFNQLTVDIEVQLGNLVEALILAETGKNICLRWLLGIEEIPEIEYSQIQTFLNSTTAAVYWHLSPAALTTFVLLPNEPTPILIQSATVPEENDQRPASLLQLLEWEKWLTAWNKDYKTYGSSKDQQKTGKKGDRTKNHPWRIQMPARLKSLGQILNITDIEDTLNNHSIQNLILMPHRDLHRFPIHALFSSQFTVTYLPSFQMGIMLQNRQLSPNDGLLSIENPTQDLGFARVEAEGINQYFSQVKSIREETATKTELENSITDNFSVFHFAGHAEHVPENPQQSRLKLSYDNSDPEQDLTLADLSHNAFSGYSLVTLSACETALTNNQTITSEYVGLVSGFLRSGATQVVSTLWTVESGASALVMIEFYRQRSLGKSNSKALAAAIHWLRNLTAKDLQQWRDNFLSKLPLESSRRKTSIKQSLRSENWDIINPETKVYDSPYYWAAFIISGQVP